MAVRFDDPEFREVTPHHLRYTAAPLAISAGANGKAVQTMLRHAYAAMTLETYADLFPDDLEAVVGRLGEVRGASIGKTCVHSMSRHDEGPPPPKRKRPLAWSFFCGAKGNRTPDLLDANEARYQLRYSPSPPSRAMLPPS